MVADLHISGVAAIYANTSDDHWVELTGFDPQPSNDIERLLPMTILPNFDTSN